jgi:hypothetical protein
MLIVSRVYAYNQVAPVSGGRLMPTPKDNRYLTVRALYPGSGRADDIPVTADRVPHTARQFEGLVEIDAWLDKEHDCIVNISLWESREHAMAATAEMHSLFAGIPRSEWEHKPADSYLGLTRAV